MKNLTEIEKEIQKLESERQALISKEREKDLKTVRELCKKNSFTKTDLGGTLRTRKRRAS